MLQRTTSIIHVFVCWVTHIWMSVRCGMMMEFWMHSRSWRQINSVYCNVCVQACCLPTHHSGPTYLGQVCSNTCGVHRTNKARSLMNVLVNSHTDIRNTDSTWAAGCHYTPLCEECVFCICTHHDAEHCFRETMFRCQCYSRTIT